MKSISSLAAECSAKGTWGYFFREGPRRAAKTMRMNFSAKGPKGPLRDAKPCGLSRKIEHAAWLRVPSCPFVVKNLRFMASRPLAALHGKTEHAAWLRAPSCSFVVKNIRRKASRPLAALRGKTEHAAWLRVPSCIFVVKTLNHMSSRPFATLR